jgi:hypothetical protein
MKKVHNYRKDKKTLKQKVIAASITLFRYQRKKENIEKPIFDDERLLYAPLSDPNFQNPLQHNFKHKHL